MDRSKDRKPNRAKFHHYSEVGHYFLTLTTKGREHFFGHIHQQTAILNDIGKIANQCWLDIPLHFSNVVLDEFIIMPNHIHGILIIPENAVRNNVNLNVGNNDRCSLRSQSEQQIARNMELLPKVISQYKSSVTREVRKVFGDYHFGWQKSFYDHIIRHEVALDSIRRYIADNPIRWDDFLKQ